MEKLKMKIALLALIIVVVAYSIFAHYHKWSKSYSQTVENVEIEDIWRVWADINNWNTWQNDIDYAKLENDFKAGNTFILKPKGVSEVIIELIEVIPNKTFTDLTRFPLAKMYGKHEFIQHGDKLEIKTTMSVDGYFGFIWRKIVAEDVASGMEDQTKNLIKKAKNG